MDTEKNEFVEITPEQAARIPDRYIPFAVGEEVEVKGYIFRVARVKVGKNELLLKPVGLKTLTKKP